MADVSVGEASKLSWMTMTNERSEEDRSVLQRFRQALNSETRRIILNRIYLEPKTGAQIADELGISRASVSDHLRILREAEIITEKNLGRDDKRYVVEKYYTVNFPVVLQADRELFDDLTHEIGHGIVELVAGFGGRIKETFSRSTLAGKGWRLADIYPYVESMIRDAATRALGQNHGVPDWTSGKRPWCMIGFEYTEGQLEELRPSSG